MGPTASGKTRLAALCAHQLQSEIISVDSRQVYRHMIIGTGKDYADYLVNGEKVPVHLLDMAEPGTSYHIHQYLLDFTNIFNQLAQKKIRPIICGGTALYLHALLQGFHFTSVPVNEVLRLELAAMPADALLQRFHAIPPTAYTQLADLSTTKRLIRAIEICTWLLSNQITENTLPKIQPVVFGLNISRELRRKRIEMRLTQRLQQGLVDEVAELLGHGIQPDQLIRYGLEYKYVVLHLQGKLTLDDMQLQLTIAIQQFAKRQMTFFRKMEREGLPVHWIDAALPPMQQLKIVTDTLSLPPYSTQ